MGAFFLASLFRETDGLLDCLLFHGSWKAFVFPLVALALAISWRNRRELLTEISRYISTNACGLFIGGGMTTYLFSRFFGRSFIWEHIMRENYVRNVKNAAEESIELLGYIFLFCATVELVLLARRTLVGGAEKNPAEQVAASGK